MSGLGRGLVVGKFCPLHLGHEHLIRTAAERCDELLVISYTKPEFPRCEPAARRTWLSTRFPNIRSIVLDDGSLAEMCRRKQIPARKLPSNGDPDHAHREFVAWLCLDVLEVAVDAVFTSESYGDGFALALGEAFASRGRPRTVAHVCVDPSRSAFPVSATMIRQDPHRHRAFLSRDAYRSFVDRVCVLGGESSGKSTLSARLAVSLGTCAVQEYGRTLWEEREGRLEFHDMLRIAKVQIEKEDATAAEAYRALICDTSPLTTLFYSLDLFGRAEAELEALASRSYACTLLCAPDFPFVQDGTRRDAAFRQMQHQWYLEQLERRGMPYVLVSGGIEQRIDDAIRAIERVVGLPGLEPGTKGFT